MLRKYIVAGFMLLCSAFNCVGANAYYANYLPEQILLNSSKLKQKKLGEISPDGSLTAPNGVQIECKEAVLSLKGVDKAGRPWTIKDENERGFGGTVYFADVDKNGYDDLIFLFGTAACGMPFQALDIAFVAADGTVKYTELLSRFSEEEDGIDDIRVGKDGHTYLLLQDLSYSTLGKRDFSYWRFSAMKAENCALSDVPSAFGLRLPCFVWFTTKPNHKLSLRTPTLEKQYQIDQKRMAQESAK